MNTSDCAAHERNEKRRAAREQGGVLPLKGYGKPRARGSSGKGSEDKMIIVARADEDVSYLSLYFPDIPHTVYQVTWAPNPCDCVPLKE
jgi:hypothetical protein